VINEFVDDLPPNEVLLEYPLEGRKVDALIIYPTGVDDHHRAIFAYIQAAGKQAFHPNRSIELIETAGLDHFDQGGMDGLRILRRGALTIIADEHFAMVGEEKSCD